MKFKKKHSTKLEFIETIKWGNYNVKHHWILHTAELERVFALTLYKIGVVGVNSTFIIGCWYSFSTFVNGTPRCLPIISNMLVFS